MWAKGSGNKKDLVLSLVLIEAVVITILALLTWNLGHDTIANFIPLPATTTVIDDAAPAAGESQNTGDSDSGAGDDADETITVNLVGDILLASRVEEVINAQGPDYPWAEIADALAAADITVGNLECAVGVEHYQPVPDKEFTFLAPPKALQGAQNAGIDVLTLANNHILDFGPGAMRETINHLDQYGIRHTGAGENRARAAEPVIINTGDLSVGVVSFTYVFPSTWWVAGENTPGVNSGHDYQSVYNSVQELSSKTDLTIVSLHWGRELADKPSVEQQKLARQLIDHGADIILGHHPHVLQGLELYNQGLIAYSTGNFIFTLSRDTRGRQTVILQADADSNGITGARVFPAWIEYGRTVPADEQQSQIIINRLQNLSRELGTQIDDRGEITSIAD